MPSKLTRFGGDYQADLAVAIYFEPFHRARQSL